jgi:hypothetical protein
MPILTTVEATHSTILPWQPCHATSSQPRTGPTAQPSSLISFCAAERASSPLF